MPAEADILFRHWPRPAEQVPEAWPASGTMPCLMPALDDWSPEFPKDKLRHFPHIPQETRPCGHDPIPGRKP